MKTILLYLIEPEGLSYILPFILMRLSLQVVREVIPVTAGHDIKCDGDNLSKTSTQSTTMKLLLPPNNALYDYVTDSLIRITMSVYFLSYLLCFTLTLYFSHSEI